MNVVLIDDDPISRLLLSTLLKKIFQNIMVFEEGHSGLDTLNSRTAPTLALIDWMMPGMKGIEVCRRVRAHESKYPLYIIMVASRDLQGDKVLGLESGADDYITKPYDAEELVARIQVGKRNLALQEQLAARIRELEKAADQIQKLEELLPICFHCKKIRDGAQYWKNIEDYIAEHWERRVTHSLCPTCAKTHYGQE